MMREFGFPVALAIIDTAGTAAQYEKTGDENDPVVGKKIMSAMSAAARECGIFVFGIDHFGKAIETGTRGASSKEADADVVFALLAEKSITGALTNPRLAIRKRRSGPNGLEFPFRTKPVDLGEDDFGSSITTLTIEWLDPKTTVGASLKPDLWTKSLRLLRQTLMNMLADCGSEQRPFPDGPLVRAVDLEQVRAEFYKAYPAEGDAKAKSETRRKAFNRAIKSAQANGLIGIHDIGVATYVWLAAPFSSNAAEA
jgi:hypothetical protein